MQPGDADASADVKARLPAPAFRSRRRFGVRESMATCAAAIRLQHVQIGAAHGAHFDAHQNFICGGLGPISAKSRGLVSTGAGECSKQAFMDGIAQTLDDA